MKWDWWRIHTTKIRYLSLIIGGKYCKLGDRQPQRMKILEITPLSVIAAAGSACLLSVIGSISCVLTAPPQTKSNHKSYICSPWLTGLSIGSLIQYTIHQLVCIPASLNIGLGVYIAHPFHVHFDSYPSLRHILITSEPTCCVVLWFFRYSIRQEYTTHPWFRIKQPLKFQCLTPAYVSYDAFCGHASKI